MRLQEAVAIFGPEYPRSQAERKRFLEEIQGDVEPYKGPREEWDPFFEMDDRFCAANRTEFDEAADRWLHEVCGIRSLHDGPTEGTRTAD